MLSWTTDALVFQGWTVFKKINGLQVVLSGSGPVFQKKKLTDTGFDLVFLRTGFFTKTYWTVVFRIWMDGTAINQLLTQK